MSSSRAISSLGIRERRLSFFVGRLAIVAAVGHALILVFSIVADIRLLVFVNVGSVALYLSLFALNRTERYTIVLIATIVEIVAHATVATMLLGWNAAFHLYILCLIPLLFYVDRWPLQIRGITSLAVLLTYLGLAVVSDQGGALIPPQDVPLLQIVRYGNLAMTAGVLIALSVFYQAAVTRAEWHMQDYSNTLERLSTLDPLTGALNRRGTIAGLDQALALGSRNGTETAVVLMDLDHFKSINDTHGHESGDEVLKAVVNVAGRVIRGSDSVGRWGGEEFLAVLPSAGYKGATAVAERIREEIARIAIPAPDDGDIHVTTTIGIAVHNPEPGVMPGEKVRAAIISAADAALYEGKKAGRNRVVWASSAAGEVDR